MKDNKAPGCDGLPAEFYKKYFNVIGHQFVQVINSETTHLAESHRLSIITLLCKDPGKADNLSNRRPISLLNVDNKIVSKVITNRLKLVAGSVIGAEQTCGIAGRSIFDNLHFLRNTFDYNIAGSGSCHALQFASPWTDTSPSCVEKSSHLRTPKSESA